MRRNVLRVLTAFPAVAVPLTVGSVLAYRRVDWRTWLFLVGMPLVAGLAGYGLGRARALQHVRFHEERDEEPV